jgi:membrane-associated phospholipid phosphatase
MAKRKKVKRRLKRANPLERLDLAAGAWAAAAGRKPPLKYLAQVGELADQPPLLALSIGTIALGAMRNDERLLDTGKRMLVAFGAATLAKSTLKAGVDRTRPSLLLDEGAHVARARKPKPSKSDALKSFPSGHTAGAVAIARAIGHNYPRLERPLMIAALAAGALKVFKGDHYPSDVLAGVALGLISEGAVAAGDRAA